MFRAERVLLRHRRPRLERQRERLRQLREEQARHTRRGARASGGVRLGDLHGQHHQRRARQRQRDAEFVQRVQLAAERRRDGGGEDQLEVPEAQERAQGKPQDRVADERRREDVRERHGREARHQRGAPSDDEPAESRASAAPAASAEANCLPVRPGSALGPRRAPVRSVVVGEERFRLLRIRLREQRLGESRAVGSRGVAVARIRVVARLARTPRVA